MADVDWNDLAYQMEKASADGDIGVCFVVSTDGTFERLDSFPRDKFVASEESCEIKDGVYYYVPQTRRQDRVPLYTFPYQDGDVFLEALDECVIVEGAFLHHLADKSGFPSHNVGIAYCELDCFGEDKEFEDMGMDKEDVTAFVYASIPWE